MRQLQRHNKHENSSGKTIGVLFGVWIAAVYAVVILASMRIQEANAINSSSQKGVNSALILLVIAIIWPIGYFGVSRYRFIPTRIRTGNLLAIIIFLSFCLLSAFNSPTMIQSAAFSVLTLLSIWIALQFNSIMSPSHYETGLRAYAIIIIIILSALSYHDYAPGVRLGGGEGIMNPNAIALVSTSAGLAAMTIRRWLIRYSLIGIVLVIIYLTGSRASAIGILIGLSVVAYERTRFSSNNLQVLVGLLVLSGILTLVVSWDTAWPQIDGFLQIHNRHRGIESGASGRNIIWAETWKLFLDNPVIGIGYRAHETVLGVSAHNGYLATLAEIGVFGFTAVMYMILSGVFLLKKKVREKDFNYTYSVFYGICIGYLFLAMWERFLINVGNPTSLLFLVAILVAIKAPPPNNARVSNSFNAIKSAQTYKEAESTSVGRIARKTFSVTNP